MNFNCREDLITALTYDIKRNKNITFLFGSAISIDGNGVGVPSVKGVINIIQDFISEVGLKEQYESRLSDCDPTSVYQESFDFLFNICSCHCLRIIQLSSFEGNGLFSFLPNSWVLLNTPL